MRRLQGMPVHLPFQSPCQAQRAAAFQQGWLQLVVKLIITQPAHTAQALYTVQAKMGCIPLLFPRAEEAIRFQILAVQQIG